MNRKETNLESFMTNQLSTKGKKAIIGGAPLDGTSTSTGDPIPGQGMGDIKDDTEDEDESRIKAVCTP